MTLLKKLFNGMTLRCCGALAVGLGIVCVITVGLLVLSGGMEDLPGSHLAAYNNLRFPEDEEMLKEQSAQILKESALAAAAKDLKNVQPAAGDNAPGKSEK